ncbi:hypothetical protein QQA05_00210 [Corynebacterium macclintockiae]|uniref:hypothetical protein n=1 Tax=Corynebacterium macclintockiae TaxID=2913501 RepID=UPI00254F438F|nr:hypothetical protein [Corynebacterium macclintockiae]MDK8889837.1 hypothetical protein [Corynebacterium macclintockiae]
MTTIHDQIRALTDADFRDLKTWIITEETTRRAQEPAIKEAAREAKAEVVAEVTERLAEKDTKLKPPAKADEKVRAWKAWHPLDTTTHFYYGDLATNTGKTWRNTLDETRTQLNVWEPGAPGIDERYWVEVVEDKDEPEGERGSESTEDNTADTPEPAKPTAPKVAPYKQPVGSHDAYNKGDKVTFNGNTWESTIDNNVWSPSDYPQGWKKV